MKGVVIIIDSEEKYMINLASKQEKLPQQINIWHMTYTCLFSLYVVNGEKYIIYFYFIQIICYYDYFIVLIII